MNKWLIAIAAMFALSGAVQAGEEIKLAAAIGSGAAAKPAPSQSGTASSDAASTGTMTTANMVTVGVIAAAGLAVVANSDSSSSH